MKISEYSVVDLAPIKRFEIAGLTDVVVFAGPNGVGKTTLLNGLLKAFQSPGSNEGINVCVSSTHPDETGIWGRRKLDTRVPEEVQILRNYLQRRKKRGSLRGGVLNIDSARAFEQIQPYQWQWRFHDPFEEDIGWDYTFRPMRNRFQDVIHALVRKVRSQKEEIANQAIERRRAGEQSLDLKQFGDPIGRFKDAFSRLLPGKRMLDINEETQVIQYQQGGQTLNLTSLSSGEREVVTVVFDFILRNPTDSIIVFDEPELHLHPELSYRLLRTLQDVGERNQFVFCTHSPEIITAALEQSVVFVSPVQPDNANQARKVEENDDVASVLRALGQSVGVISLGKKIVLIEGEKGSLDKETYGSIIGAKYPDLVLVPAGGKDTISSFQSAIHTVLNKTIWGVDFFMVCDGDAAVRGLSGSPISRLRLLSRYHLENYFLDENTWVKVFEALEVPEDDLLRDPTKIRAELRRLAQAHVSYAVALRVANHFRQKFGNVDIMPSNCGNADVSALKLLLEKAGQAEVTRCGVDLDATAVSAMCTHEFKRIEDALNNDNEDWKALIPGRPILKKFAASAKQDYATLKRLYIKHAKQVNPSPFAEIDQIFQSFQSAT